MRIKNLILFLLFLLIPLNAFAARQDLDEALARKARYSTNTFYSGESGSYYIWQPETLSYTDTNTGHEVWALVWKPGSEDLWGPDHGLDAWAGDGSRMIFSDAMNLRISGDPTLSSLTRKWIVNIDGTVLRGLGGPLGGRESWSQVTQNLYYTAGGANTGTYGQTYKVTIDSNNTPSATLVKDLTTAIGNSVKTIARNGLGGGDKWLLLRDENQKAWGTPNPVVTKSQALIFLNLSDLTFNYWGDARGIGNYAGHTNLLEGDTSYDTILKDTWAVGGPTIPWVMQFFSNDNIWPIFKKSGSDTDGGPQFHVWNGSSWGSPEEIKIISDPVPVNPYGNPYFGHPVVDRWGRYILAGQYAGTMGTHVFDSTAIINSNLSGDQATVPLHVGSYDGYHHSWYGWTDYVVGDEPDTQANFKTNKWNVSSASQITVASYEYCGYHSDYGSYGRPSQSPDGTKIAFSSVLLHSPYDGSSTEDQYYGIYYAVAMYPYPPEIYQASATGGTVTVRFDWGTNSTTWRGYTARKWPSETTGEYLPPRETSKFRLWRSTDKTTWTPIRTVDANIFTKYDFANGGYKGGQTSYWDITDSPGNGTFYYMISAIENSGLESRQKSNIFAITVSGGSGTGSQDTAYPSDPGCLSCTKYYSSYNVSNSSLLRHFNIYALDGSAPTAIQQRRIASISKNVCSSGNCSWVDWLGKTDGTTQYLVTPVDTFGNEGSSLSLTVTHNWNSPTSRVGQYKIDWSDLMGAVTVPNSPKNLRIQ